MAVLAGALLCALSWAPSASAAVIGIDGVHGFDNAAKLTGGNFDQLRQAIINQGHTLVTLNSFNAASLAGLDGAIFMTPYSQNNHSYSAAERAAIQAFASQRGVFVSDSSLWTDDGAGSDRPISFGDNQRLLENSVNFVAQGSGAIFLADNGTGFQVANMNLLVSTYGISFAAGPTDGGGRTVSNFLPHAVIAGVNRVGVDFQLPITTNAPSMDLTVGAGNENILSVFEVQQVPEPVTWSALLIGLAALGISRRRKTSK